MNYYYNGTVSQEQWAWSSANTSYTVTILMQPVPPASIFIPYQDRDNTYNGTGANADPDTASLPNGWIKRIYNLPPTNTSVFFYAPDPSLIAS